MIKYTPTSLPTIVSCLIYWALLISMFLLIIWAAGSEASELTPRQEKRLLHCYQTTMKDKGRFTKEYCDRNAYLFENSKLRDNHDTSPESYESKPYRSWDE